MSAAITIELQRAAAQVGTPVAAVALEAARLVLEQSIGHQFRGGSIAAEQWRNMPNELRAVLLSLCTNRADIEGAQGMAWHQFTVDERIAMGTTAREWQRRLSGAGWLR